MRMRIALSMRTIVLLLTCAAAILLCGCGKKEGQESRTTARDQSGEGELLYELVPLVKALETGRLSGQVANSLSIGQMVHQNTMRKVIDDLEAKHNLHDTDDPLRETLDVLLREAREVRDVATHQLLVFDKHSGNIVIISKFYTDILEAGFNGYGVVLPSTHWGYMPPFASEATEADWNRARDARVNAGRWAGAYMLSGRQILLPGFQSLGQLSISSATRAKESQNTVAQSVPDEFSSVYGNYSVHFHPFEYGWTYAVGHENLLIDNPKDEGQDIFLTSQGAFYVMWRNEKESLKDQFEKGLKAWIEVSKAGYPTTAFKVVEESKPREITIDGKPGLYSTVTTHIGADDREAIRIIVGRINFAAVRSGGKTYFFAINYATDEIPLTNETKEIYKAINKVKFRDFTKKNETMYENFLKQFHYDGNR